MRPNQMLVGSVVASSDEDEDTTEHKRKGYKTQEIRQFLISYMIRGYFRFSSHL